MRLVCPNCGAQYEVDDRVIPESGRDVQCSACGHAWFQLPVRAEDDAAAQPEPEEAIVDVAEAGEHEADESAAEEGAEDE
ncbi:MAG: hypothetical protein D6801_07530, partial [Alphaproteobacteria bacterium]